MKKLLDLQGVDSEIAAVDALLALLPDQRQRCRDGLEAAAAALVAARDELEVAELSERRLESQMKEQEAETERLSAQMGEVTSQHAYEALQREIQHSGESGSTFETQALELMETIDRASESRQAAAAKLAELEAGTPQALKEIDAEQQRLDAHRTQLVQQRGERAQDISADLLRRYEKAAARRSPAAVALTGKACSGCRMELPALLLRQIRHEEAIEPCPSCHRLIVPESAAGD